MLLPPYKASAAESGLGQVTCDLDPKFIVKTGSITAAKQIADMLNEAFLKAYELGASEDA